MRTYTTSNKEKRQSAKGFLLAAKEFVPLPEEFGKVVAALVAVDSLPPIYPEMAMGARRRAGSGGE